MVSLTTSPYVPALILLLTLPILALLIVPHILPPSRLSITHSDELDDLSLFDKAIHADRDFKKQPHRHPHRPSNKIRFNSNAIKSPKIAFLFLTNSDLTFSPIWNLYFNQTDAHLFNIYVHSDPYIKIKSLDGFFKDRIIPSKRTQRSSPTLISAARRLLATAILDDPRNLYFALISQHCVPLHSFAFFYNTLFDADGINQGLPSYIEIIDKEVNLWDRYNARGMDVMAPKVEFSQFRVGSQFFVISRKHAVKVIEDRRLWRKFRLPCLNVESCYPEEHYFPTLL